MLQLCGQCGQVLQMGTCLLLQALEVGLLTEDPAVGCSCGERIGTPSSWAQIPCPGSACSDPPPNQEVLVSQSWPGEAPTSRRALLCPFSPPTPLSLGPWALC